MNRIIKTVLLIVIIFLSGWLLFNRNQIQSPNDILPLAAKQLNSDSLRQFSPFQLVSAGEKIQPTDNRSELVLPPTPGVTMPGIAKRNDVIRVASFRIAPLGSLKRIEAIVDICQRFDVLAIQNQSELQMPQLITKLNQLGYDYRFIDKRGADSALAIVFNQQSVVLENQHWYSVNDPESLFSSKPLVGWFRVAGVPVERAFTFTMANIQISPHEADQELKHLGQLFRAIRQDGRGEDDILLAGDFQANEYQLTSVLAGNNLNAAIAGLATNTQKNRQYDNLLFNEISTVEYSGQSGVFDFMKRFNFTLTEAQQVSDRMPVWVELSIFEGHTPGRAVANSTAR